MSVTELPVKPKHKRGSNIFSLVPPYGGCDHVMVEIDEKLDQLKCLDCSKLVNPMWYIAQLAKKEHRLWERTKSMRTELELAATRSKTKCQHCGKMTRVNLGGVPQSIVIAMKQRIEADE